MGTNRTSTFRTFNLQIFANTRRSSRTKTGKCTYGRRQQTNRTRTRAASAICAIARSVASMLNNSQMIYCNILYRKYCKRFVKYKVNFYKNSLKEWFGQEKIFEDLDFV